MIVFLVEEESMCAALQQLLPKIFPGWVLFGLVATLQ